MRRTLLLSLALLSASALFALLSQSTFGGAFAVCRGQWYNCPGVVYWWKSYAELSEGFAVGALLSVLLLAAPNVPGLFSRPIRLPRALRVGILWASLTFLVLYLWTVGLDLAYRIPSLSHSAMTMQQTYFSFYLFTYGGQFHSTALGLAGLLFLAGAASLFFVYGLPKGAASALRGAVVLSAVGALVLMAGLVIFDWNEMPLHATNFTLWALPYPDTFYLVSNWFVLVVASTLTILGLKR